MSYANVTDTSGIYCRDDFLLETEKYEFSILGDGQTFDLGNYTVETIFIPGHTMGSCAYLLKEDRILLTGDGACSNMLLAFNSNDAGHEHDTIENYKATLEKINARNGEWDKLLYSHTNGELRPKTDLDDLITCCSNIMTDYPENTVEQNIKFSKNVNGNKIYFDTSMIYNK